MAVRLHPKGAEPTSIGDQLANALAETHTVTDVRGRVFVLRKPQPLAQFRLVRLLDPDAAQNQAYVMMLFPLLFVHKIDEELVPFPQSEREIEGLISQLDQDGLDAVMAAIKDHWGAEASPADRDAVKN